MKHSRIVLPILVGCAVAVIAPLFQPHFKAGSFLDFACEVFLLPGQLIASPFHDRGTASPEFLWRSRVATAILFGGLTYGVLHYQRSPRGTIKTILVGLSLCIVLFAGSLLWFSYGDCTGAPKRLFHRFVLADRDFFDKNTRFRVRGMGSGRTPEGYSTDFTSLRTSDCVEVTIETVSMSTPMEAEGEMEKKIRNASRVVERRAKLNLPTPPDGERAVLLFDGDARAEIVL